MKWSAWLRPIPLCLFFEKLWDKNLIHIRWGKTRRAERHVPMSERVKQMLVGRLKASKSD
jgi:hypothetical protein